jgi:iron complex transport system substrate-binding protein
MKSRLTFLIVLWFGLEQIMGWAAEPYLCRIVSTVPNFTEILFALGLEDRVAGVTDFCHYPPEASRKEKIGGFLNPNMEKIISLKPDLVLLPKTKSPLAQKMRGLGIPILEIPNETIADVLNAITSIAQSTGVSERGENLKKRLEKEISTIQQSFSARDSVRTLVIVAHSPDSLKDLYAAAPGTFLDELLTIAGGTNILRRGQILYPKISKESLVMLNPEAILDTSYAGNEFTTDTLRAALRPWKSLPTIKAVKENRVYFITDPSITIPGPRMADSARYIADLLHAKRKR